MKLSALQPGKHSARKWHFHSRVKLRSKRTRVGIGGKTRDCSKERITSGQKMGGKPICRRRNAEKWGKMSRLRWMFAARAWLDFPDPKKETWGLCSRLSPPFCQLEGFRWVELEEGLMKPGNWASQAAKWCSQQIGWLDWFSDWCCSWSRSRSSRWDKLSRRSDNLYWRRHGSSFGL